MGRRCSPTNDYLQRRASLEHDPPMRTLAVHSVLLNRVQCAESGSDCRPLVGGEQGAHGASSALPAR
jgi:hypothetical protein